MDPARFQRIEELFQKALEREPADRGTFLDHACCDDLQLRREVAELLAQQGSHFDHRPAGLSRLTDPPTGSLSPGMRLGPYEIVSHIGTGGTGEVWKARDTRLGRSVAIKKYSARFSDRFEREARAVAALNHPDICTLHDAGSDYLVMEYVEGVPLQGPMPPARALALASRLAGALDTAHRRGIIHRDLKPANVLVTKTGIKVLDFGLAKFERPESPSEEAMNGPLTQPGMVIGTVQYMSPEQVRGKSADARSDIFAFGCVLYEMLTGHKAFPGDTIAAVMDSIVGHEAPKVKLEPFNSVLQKCLAKNPEDRWQSARDLKTALKWIGLSGDEQKIKRPFHRFFNNAAWPFVAALLAVAVAVLAFIRFSGAPPQVPVIRSAILPPPNTVFQIAPLDSAPPALSPDGRLLVFGATSEDGHSQLYVRPLNALTAQPLAGTEGGNYPFWSSDSKSIGFGAAEKLMRIDVAGGSVVTLAPLEGFRGGSWSPDGMIVFANATGPLEKVSATGGTAAAVTAVAVTPNANSHRWPWFLPDGRHFLYLATAGGALASDGEICIGSLDGGAGAAGPSPGRMPGKADSQAVYSGGLKQGYVIFVRGQTLMAQPFDATRMETTGDPGPLAERIAASPNSANAPFTVSPAGLLVWQSVGVANRSLVWFDRAGKRTGTVGDPGNLFLPRLSPDRKLAALSITTDGIRDIWIYDLDRGVRNRLTLNPGTEDDAVWSQDGESIAFSSNRRGHFDLYRKPVNRAETEELIYADDEDKYPTSWSPDGKYLIYQGFGRNGGIIVFALPMSGDRKPFALLPGVAGYNPQFSPDGHWVAYQSSQSGRSEVYVSPFPGPGVSRKVSVSGGTLPRWRADGRELYYVAPDQTLTAAETILKKDDFEVGEVRPLFGGMPAGAGFQYDVSLDGQRFLVAMPLPESPGPPEPLTLVLNWMAMLKK